MTAPLELGEPAHVGHIVADLVIAMDQYTQELGVRWAPIVEYGRGKNRSRFSCTVGGRVLIEVIEQVPGTLWTPENGSPFHHLAYWTDDLAAATTALVERGLVVEAGGPTFAYLRSSAGMRLELMDTAVQPAWDRWLAGAAFQI
jgi:hypothetical protein